MCYPQQWHWTDLHQEFFLGKKWVAWLWWFLRFWAYGKYPELNGRSFRGTRQHQIFSLVCFLRPRIFSTPLKCSQSKSKKDEECSDQQWKTQCCLIRLMWKYGFADLGHSRWELLYLNSGVYLARQWGVGHIFQIGDQKLKVGAKNLLSFPWKICL